MDFELLVVDDGSTDGAPAYLASIDDPRLRVITNERNLRLIASLNRGLEEARGDLIARMDADDVSLPGRLASQAALLGESGADICFGRCIIEDGRGERPWTEPPWPLVVWRSLFENAFGPHPAVMFRRESVLRIGAYSPGFPHAEDYDLWERCLAGGLRFAYLPAQVLRYRRHGEAITNKHAGEMAAAAERISLRALGRAFPEADETELLAFRWLMTGAGSPGTGAVGGALSACVHRASIIAQVHGGAADILDDLTTRLLRRLGEMGADARASALKAMFHAAARCRSPRLMGRALKATARRALT